MHRPQAKPPPKIDRCHHAGPERFDRLDIGNGLDRPDQFEIHRKKTKKPVRFGRPDMPRVLAILLAEYTNEGCVERIRPRRRQSCALLLPGSAIDNVSAPSLA